MSGCPSWLDPRDDRVARAAWTRLAEPGDAAASRVVSALGAGPALVALVERPEELSGYLKDARSVAGWRTRLEQAQPLRDLQTVARFGGSLVIPSDAAWPSGLAALGPREPLALWARGPLSLAVPPERSVAMVGCRASSGYGDWVAAEFAAGFADRGLTVVSGAAYGIDAQAHRGALAAGGPTTAVLACGVDRPYPRGNEDLVERIAAVGVVVSEVPPGSSPTRWRFITRNRVIAALSGVTVVVEAGWRSGASITAREANDLGRPVAVVPGQVTSATSAGCHRLLREGAVCVTEAAEVVELLAPLGAEQTPRREAPAAVHDGLDEGDLRVLDALPLGRPVELAKLAPTAGVDLATLRAALARLELAGLAVRSGPAWRRAPVVKPERLLGDRPPRRRPVPRQDPLLGVEQLFDPG
jgi:DNA processing protein